MRWKGGLAAILSAAVMASGCAFVDDEGARVADGPGTAESGEVGRSTVPRPLTTFPGSDGAAAPGSSARAPDETQPTPQPIASAGNAGPAASGGDAAPAAGLNETIPPAASTPLPPLTGLPSPYPRSPRFCEAGANLFRTGTALFEQAAGSDQRALRSQIADFLTWWDKAIEATPPELYDAMAGARSLRESAALPLLRVTSFAEYRTLAARLFSENGPLFEAIGGMISWCGGDPAGRSDPVP